ncbi:histidinol-phosphate transaminase [Undibacterium sp.]|uniref:histidinol-phosphate transaminase n=1 Tax=Undibacterium sp. TaxID=1914977 RepID=UPI002BF17F6C|nr:histidinol-phosphate transaminase [Undibacterium sp.]HTD04745.1 histidinol-phosphate transaminase [Undibacterium sp.]
MSKFWSDSIRSLEPYVPGEQPAIAGIIKLNTNENPYPPSPAALAAIRQAADEGLRLYPDPNASALKQAVADSHGLSAEHVFVGNGSDEVLAHACRALLRHTLPILFPDISYSFYPVYCNLYQIQYRQLPLNAEFEICIDDYLQANGGIVLANPNAPTGCAIGRSEIRRLLERNKDSVVVIDEAYIDFGGETVVPLVEEFDNLLVVQTLSKSRSLAGLRVGFAIGHPVLIEALERVKGSFNSYPLDRLAIVGAVAAMHDREYFETTRRQVMDSRDRLTAELANLGFHVLPSQANFLFARHAQHDAGRLLELLRQRKILVRHFRKPRIDQFLRISVGTDVQCQALVDALKEILADAGSV